MALADAALPADPADSPAHDAPDGEDPLRLLNIEVVFSVRAGEMDRVQLQLAPGATVLDALRASGLLQRHGQLDLERAAVWGRVQPSAHVLRDQDRVEFLRPLVVDPKEARHRRHRQQRRKPAR